MVAMSGAKAHWAWLSRSLARRAVVFAWVASFATAWFVVSPLLNQISSALSNQPRGDAVLFDPGAALLLELLGRHGDDLLAASYSSLDLLVLAVPLWLFSSALLYVALCCNEELEPTFGTAARRAFALVPAYGLLWLVTRVAQALCVGLLVITSSTLLQALDYKIDERLEGTLNIAVLALGLVLAVVLQYVSALVAFELARGERVSASFATGYGAFRSTPLGAAPWLAYQFAALLLHAAAAGLVGSFQGAPNPFVVALIHQVTMLASFALQATALESVRARSAKRRGANPR